MSKIKVCLSALWFPLTMAGYFWRAFERRKDVELFVTGPFSDDYIPWNYGMKLPREYVKVPDYPLPIQSASLSGKMPAEFVSSRLPWKPDLWLQIDAGWHLATRPDAGVVGHIQTDPHVLKGMYRLPKSYSDISWCMQTPYMEEGEIYLPYAYDYKAHYPESVPQCYDACLIGLHYPQRDDWVNRLKQRGVNVYYSIGEIYNEYRQKYCQSKVALSWSSMDDLPARVWEGMAMGVPVVTNRVPDLTINGFEEGVHYLGFDTVEEAEKQVVRLLISDTLRESIAHNANKKVHNQTWDLRVDQILKDAKLL